MTWIRRSSSTCAARAGFAVDDIDDLLNYRSGLLGMTGDNDMRAVLRRRAEGEAAASLAFDVYSRRIKGYVGAYYALLGRVDAITFTAGIGEKSPEIRAASLAGLERLGIAVDPQRNAGSGDRVISPPEAEIAVCVVATDEELEIVEETVAVLEHRQLPAGTTQPVPEPERPKALS